ncbi:hypothetical protein NQ317_008504 [Molorchus minor]|uniref:G-protein coupled receptors family 1 profile domain-containing protein n=1 Tax=Molorchus minor TaxID=1323400 RepID=A0ABQ9JL07_9CUCU|nr:hypothetical protein NQ317_008504 [Molorchus minor]
MYHSKTQNPVILARIKMANFTYVTDKSLKLIPESSRSVFFWIILVITVLAVVSNTSAIVSMVKRKLKSLQKVCIVSLAVSDLFSIIIFATNNLDTLSRDLKVWELGEFLCYFIPMGQILGTNASSFALLVIALDRYQNVSVAVIRKKWNPNLWTSVLLIVASWIVSAVTAYPMFVFFTYNPIKIVYTNGTEPLFEDSYMCIAIQKDSLMLYYTLMTIFIFSSNNNNFFMVLLPNCCTNLETSKAGHPSQAVSGKYSGSMDRSSPKPIIKKPKNVQMEKKLRTFKVVIALMLAFTLCRLPYWLYFVIKLVKTIQGDTMWNIHFALTSLNILNCALNPFLYTFLNQTISATKKINEITCRFILCCCCFSNSEFEDFENNNPFEINCEQRNDMGDNQKYINNNSRVKFVDVAHLQVYSKEQRPNRTY